MEKSNKYMQNNNNNNNNNEYSFYEMKFRIFNLKSFKDFHILYQEEITQILSDYFEKLKYSKNLVNVFNWNPEKSDNSGKFRFQLCHETE